MAVRELPPSDDRRIFVSGEFLYGMCASAEGWLPAVVAPPDVYCPGVVVGFLLFISALRAIT